MDVSNLPPLSLLLVYVYGFMTVCSASGILHPKLRGPEGKPIRQAINSWWPPALIGGVVVTASVWVAVAVFAGVSLGTLYEYHRMLPPESRNRVVEVFAYLAVPLHYGLLATAPNLFVAGIAAWTFGVLPLAWIFTAGPRGLTTGLLRIQWGVVLTVAALSHVVRLRTLDANIHPAGGAGLAAFLLVAVMSNDAAQYVFGKLLGRTALAPSRSPKKTWEGFIGGLVTTMIVAAVVSPLVTPFNAMQGVLIGAVLSIAGLLGDLLVSGIKRDAGVKDTGAVLPQHGGVLDRCDSLLFAAPLFFYGVRAWLQ
jgi:phosphatidate cytidylyltransferase